MSAPETDAMELRRAREDRLRAIRLEAERHGQVVDAGVRPDGAPFPVASPDAGYYGLPVLKEPQWSWEVPAYFFVGGAAGAGAVIAAAARAMGGSADLARDARWLAAAGGVVSPLLLISDLGRPERFINMLRVFKPQSPMSVGSWTLAAFGTTVTASAFAGLIQEHHPNWPVRVVSDLSMFAGAGLGLVMTTYTGVLIGATAIPVWNRHVRALPAHFAASGLGSAVSILELRGHDRSRALNALGLGAALVETAMGAYLEADASDVNAPLKRGASGWIVRSGGALSGPVPVVLRCASLMVSEKRSVGLRRLAAWSAIIGSVLTRVGWARAGRPSSRELRETLELAPKKTLDASTDFVGVLGAR